MSSILAIFLHLMISSPLFLPFFFFFAPFSLSCNTSHGLFGNDYGYDTIHGLHQSINNRGLELVDRGAKEGPVFFS